MESEHFILFLTLLQIVWIDILLSGDNAVVIALACRHLPPPQRRCAMILGTGAAIALRIIFAVVIAYLLALPYLKCAGGALLWWIALKLSREGSEHSPKMGAVTLAGAVGTIVLADTVMSFDNVLAIAGVARSSVPLIIFGLVVSIPLVIGGAALMLKFIQRFPSIVLAGGALLGWIAGELIFSDKDFLALWFKGELSLPFVSLPTLGGGIGGMSVFGLSLFLQWRAQRI